jgi:hypothetical protein
MTWGHYMGSQWACYGAALSILYLGWGWCYYIDLVKCCKVDRDVLAPVYWLALANVSSPLGFKCLGLCCFIKAGFSSVRKKCLGLSALQYNRFSLSALLFQPNLMRYLFSIPFCQKESSADLCTSLFILASESVALWSWPVYLNRSWTCNKDM